MAVQYVIRQGELVSVQWAALLDEIAKRVSFHINEGKRTLARQTYFWNCYLCKCCNNGNLAARPSPYAPHIREGRFDHAIDFDNAEGVRREAARLGVILTYTVPGESWHLEANAAELQRFYEKHKHKVDPYEVLPKHIEFAVHRLFMHRNQAIDLKHDRDSVDSKKQPKKWLARDKQYRKAVRWRGYWRKMLETYLKRARKDRTKKLIRKALHHA